MSLLAEKCLKGSPTVGVGMRTKSAKKDGSEASFFVSSEAVLCFDVCSAFVNSQKAFGGSPYVLTRQKLFMKTILVVFLG